MDSFTVVLNISRTSESSEINSDRPLPSDTTKMPPAPHRTPLRRISQGSLSALARSGTYPPGPTGLEFLEPAMEDLADEAATLHSNLEGLNKLGEALEGFNEAFAAHLYAMRMNAFCVAWHEVSWVDRPHICRAAFELFEFVARHLGMSRSYAQLIKVYVPYPQPCFVHFPSAHQDSLPFGTAENARIALANATLIAASSELPDADKTRQTSGSPTEREHDPTDMTYGTVSMITDVAPTKAAGSKATAAVVKGKVAPKKPKMSAKEKKQRDVRNLPVLLSDETKPSRS